MSSELFMKQTLHTITQMNRPIQNWRIEIGRKTEKDFRQFATMIKSNYFLVMTHYSIMVDRRPYKDLTADMPASIPVQSEFIFRVANELRARGFSIWKLVR